MACSKKFYVAAEPVQPAEDRRAALLEQLADWDHQAWAGWTTYLLDHLTPENVERWRQQIATTYADLPEHSKESDRKEAREIIAIVEAALLADRGGLKETYGQENQSGTSGAVSEVARGSHRDSFGGPAVDLHQPGVNSRQREIADGGGPPSAWECGCGTWNGLNLASCAQCRRARYETRYEAVADGGGRAQPARLDDEVVVTCHCGRDMLPIIDSPDEVLYACEVCAPGQVNVSRKTVGGRAVPPQEKA